MAVHDPGKINCDLAVSLALGGEALSDIAVLRCKPGVNGSVASDPTVSRLIKVLTQDSDRSRWAELIIDNISRLRNLPAPAT